MHACCAGYFLFFLVVHNSALDRIPLSQGAGTRSWAPEAATLSSPDLLAREWAKGGTVRLFALANERRSCEADTKPVFFGELRAEYQFQTQAGNFCFE